MGVEVFESTYDFNGAEMEDAILIASTQVNGTDARRRLEDKLEELRLRKELQDYNFDI